MKTLPNTKFIPHKIEINSPRQVITVHIKPKEDFDPTTWVLTWSREHPNNMTFPDLILTIANLTYLNG